MHFQIGTIIWCRKFIRMERNNIDKDFLSVINKMITVDGWYNPQQWFNSNSFNLYYNGGSQKIYYNYVGTQEDERKIYKSKDAEVTYYFNKEGFRTKQFNLLNKNNINILTAGCSNTFGQSMPEEKIWPTILKNKISNNNVDLYNIGVSGLDTGRIIANCYNFIKKYGAPDYLFLLLPPIQRSLVLSKNNEVATLQDPILVRSISDLSKALFKKKSKLPIILYNNLIHLINLETFCITNNIKLFWHSWDNNSQEIYEKCLFNNNISNQIFSKEMHNIIELYEINGDTLSADKYWEFAEDNDHQGFKWHLTWANTFFNVSEINDNFRI